MWNRFSLWFNVSNSSHNIDVSEEKNSIECDDANAMLFAVCKEAMRSYPSANSNTKQKPNIGHPYRKNSLWPPTYDDLSITLPYTSYFGDCLNMGFQLSFYVPTTSRHILTPLMKSLWHCLQPTGKKEKKEEEMSLITALQRDCFLIRAPSFTGSSTNRNVIENRSDWS